MVEGVEYEAEHGVLGLGTSENGPEGVSIGSPLTITSVVVRFFFFSSLSQDRVLERRARVLPVPDININTNALHTSTMDYQLEILKEHFVSSTVPVEPLK